MKKIKRLGAIGDIHAEDKLLHNAVEFLNKQELDGIVSVGDIVDGSGNADACCELLNKEQMITVAGNHESWLLENILRDLPGATQLSELSKTSRSFLKSLPTTHQLETVAGLLLLCHGIGENDMIFLRPEDSEEDFRQCIELEPIIQENDYRFIINGHTHQKMVRQFQQLTIINVGTLKWNHGASFAVIDFENGYVQFYEFYLQGDFIGEAECISW